MIMALIYRNVGRKKTNELLLLGEQISAEEAERIGIVNRVVPAEEFDAVVADWAAQLAAKSPVLMRMGKDAMFRQQDMALRGRARLPARAADDRVLDRRHPGGREGVLREARPGVDGPVSAAVVALRCRTSDRTAGGARGARGAGAAARAAARRRGADDRLARRAARRAASTTTCATRAAACSRPAARSTTRSTDGRFPVLLAVGLLDLHHDAADRAAPPPGGAHRLARRARRLQHARDDAERLPRRHVPGRRLRALGRGARRRRSRPARAW